MKTHVLKSWPAFFKGMESGEKTFEIRRNDRDFKVGDRLCIREYFPTTARYSGKELMFKVTYVTDFMQKEGNVVMGVTRIQP